MSWTKGRGVLGPLKPLLGEWVTAHSEGDTAAAAMRCTRSFFPLGKGWVELAARWEIGPAKEYLERALFGANEDGSLACYSFTSDGKRSIGKLADGSDVHPSAVAFEAWMPAGLARMIYWPPMEDEPGFRFAVESRTKKGWKRFLEQRFVRAD